MGKINVGSKTSFSIWERRQDHRKAGRLYMILLMDHVKNKEEGSFAVYSGQVSRRQWIYRNQTLILPFSSRLPTPHLQIPLVECLAQSEPRFS